MDFSWSLGVQCGSENKRYSSTVSVLKHKSALFPGLYCTVQCCFALFYTDNAVVLYSTALFCFDLHMDREREGQAGLSSFPFSFLLSPFLLSLAGPELRESKRKPVAITVVKVVLYCRSSGISTR